MLERPLDDKIGYSLVVQRGIWIHMRSGYRTIGQMNKQMVTYRMDINLSVCPYSAAEEAGPEVIWAGYTPLGHNVGLTTRFSGSEMKPDVPLTETWHKTGNPHSIGAEVSSLPFLTSTYRGRQLGQNPS